MIIPNKLNITYSVVLPNGKKSSATAESNAVQTQILSYAVSKAIASDKTSVKEGESVHNTVTFTNNSAAKLFDSFFKIPQHIGASFVEGSVKINGAAQPTYDPSVGFVLPDLNLSEKVVVEYDLKADNPMSRTPVTHFATLNYTVNDPARGDVKYSDNTDVLSFDVVSDKINVVKSVDKSLAVKGENLHYTVMIANIGNVEKSDLIFKDPVPDGTTFVRGSVKINGTNFSVYDPEIGFVLRNLAPRETLVVEFDVKVD